MRMCQNDASNILPTLPWKKMKFPIHFQLTFQ
jgi:hypothetical protein